VKAGATLKNIANHRREGDIVVNEHDAKQFTQPRIDAQGKPIRPRSGAGGTKDGAAAAPVAAPGSRSARRRNTPAASALVRTNAAPEGATPQPVKPDPNRTYEPSDRRHSRALISVNCSLPCKQLGVTRALDRGP